jgi:hypothetical protein
VIFCRAEKFSPFPGLTQSILIKGKYSCTNWARIPNAATELANRTEGRPRQSVEINE